MSGKKAATAMWRRLRVAEGGVRVGHTAGVGDVLELSDGNLIS